MIAIAPKAAAAFVVDELALFLRSRRRRGAETLVLVEAGESHRLYERTKGGARLLAEGSLEAVAVRCLELLRRRSIELRVDPSGVIDKLVRIPAASRPYANAVVRHQLDRITPWAPDKVVFDLEERGLHGQGAGAEIELRVVVMARAALASRQQACREAGIRVHRVGVASGDIDAPSGIDLSSEEGTTDIVELRGRVRTALSGLLLLGSVAVAGSFLFVDHAAREGEDLGRRIASVRAAALDLRSGAEADANPVLAMKLRPESPPAAVIVNELSRVLPEGTYLTALAIEDGAVRITGLSNGASALIGPIEASDLFTGVAFAAPVLRGQAGGLERFEILAGFAGPVS